MGFAGRPQTRSASAPSRTSSMSRGIGRISATARGGVRVHRRSKHHKMAHARMPRIVAEMMRDMMETNRAMRYAMIARATH